jgi:hypothetical protein
MRHPARLAALSAIVLALADGAHAQDFSMMSDWAQGQMLNDNLKRNLGVTARNHRRPCARFCTRRARVS